MADSVKDIVDNIESIAASTLSTGWNKLQWVFDVEKNDGRIANTAYGVRPGSAETVKGVTGSETLRQAFTLILSDRRTRMLDDSETQLILDSLYDKLDQVFKQCVRTKLNLAGTVLQVDERSIEDPILTASGLVFVESTFYVKYRQSL